MSLARSLRRTIRNAGKSPLLATALSFFPPTAAAGLTLKAYQGFRAGSADRDAMVSTIGPSSTSLVNSFFPEVFKGAAIGGVTGIVGGPLGVLIGAGVGAAAAGVEQLLEGDFPFAEEPVEEEEEEETDMEDEEQ